MKRLLLLLLPLLTFQCNPAHAQTSGQWRMSKRNANGTYTDYGVTLSNGQVIYLSSGIPAALTLNSSAVGLGNVANVDTTNASNITSGTLSAARLSTSTGGNGASDSGKLPLYDGSGGLAATGTISIIGSGGKFVNVFTDKFQYFDGTNTLNITYPTLSGDVTGQWVLTSDTGTVTSAMLAGSIAISKLSITGTPNGTKYLRDDGSWQTISTGLTIGTTTTSGASSGDILTSNGTTLQKITPGSGVATWLATPSLANFNSALSDADVATTGANTLTGKQTLTSNSPSILSFSGGTNNPAIGIGNNNFIFSLFDGAATVCQFWNWAWSFHPSLRVGWGDYHSLSVELGRQADNVLQQGADTNGDASDQTFKAADGITGTNRSGADLTLASGTGTGTGTASALIFSTPTALASGTTAQTNSERMRINSSGVTIGSGGSAMGVVKRASVTLVAGTATVSDTSTTANSQIIPVVVTPGGTLGFLDFDVSAGVGYTINSSSATDTSTIIITVIHYP